MPIEEKIAHLAEVLDDALFELEQMHGGLQEVSFKLLRRKLRDGINIADDDFDSQK